MTRALEVTLELVRTEAGGDPFAFEFRPQPYLLRSNRGGFYERTFRWDERTAEALRTLQTTQPDPVDVSAVCEQLKCFLGHGTLREDEILDAPEEVRVQLTIKARAAELYALPWELLPLGESGRTLAELPNCVVRYEWQDTATQSGGRSASDQSRVLFCWSDAGGSVPSAEHLEVLARELLGAGFPFDTERDVLAQVSYARLAERLAEAQEEGRPYTIVHLLCHGGRLASRTDAYGLIWSDDARRGPVVLPPDRLSALLVKHGRTLRLVVVCACYGGDVGTPGNPMGSVVQRLHRGGIEAVVGSRFPLSSGGSVTLTKCLYGSLLRSSESLETSLVRVRAALMERHATTLDYASVQLYAREADGWDTRPFVFRPYPGLASFRPDQARFFFGRESESAALLARVREAASGHRPRFQVVAATSGVGKSSLVLAGLLPRLIDTGWRWRVARPGDVGDAASEATAWAAEPSNAPSILVIDQLEEVFTRLPDRESRERFIQSILAIAALSTVVVATIRVDFLGRCGELQIDPEGHLFDRVVYAERQLTLLEQLDRSKAASLAEGPATRAGLRLETGLVERIVSDLADEPGWLPLFAYALDALWARREGRLLSHAAYNSLGGVVGALSKEADNAIAGLTAGERVRCRRLLGALVDVRDDGSPDTRKRAWIADERPAAGEEAVEFDRVVEVLVGSRLVVRGGDTRTALGVWLELAHEALIRRWETLRRWIDEDRGPLRARREIEDLAARWEDGLREPDARDEYLLGAKRLARAEAVAVRVGVSQRATRFLDASKVQTARHRVTAAAPSHVRAWDIICPEGPRGDLLMERIQPLVKHREATLGRAARTFRVPAGLDEVASSRWSKRAFGAAIAGGQRPSDLLILGTPLEVPFALQQELGPDYYVGRLAFNRDDDYQAYAMKVVASETEARTNSPVRLRLYTAHDGTAATTVGHRVFVQPLASAMTTAEDGVPHVSVEVVGDRYLPHTEDFFAGADGSPIAGLTVTQAKSSPREGWSSPDEQRATQGTVYLGAGAFIPAEAFATRSFLPRGFWAYFAPFSAGVPEVSAYSGIAEELAAIGGGRLRPGDLVRALPRAGEPPFVTATSMAALANPAGPLGILGVLDMAWTYAFRDEMTKLLALDPWISLFRGVCRGDRFGAAMQEFHQEARGLTNELLLLPERDGGPARVHLRMRRLSLRAMILLGDPAAHLPIEAR